MWGIKKKVPVIIQMEAVECGAASLGMILAYHGCWLTLEQLRKECGVSRDGCKASQLLMAGRKYGLNAQGMRADPEDLPEFAPCIIHWEMNHFVVFTGFQGNQVCLNDPARGRVKVSREEFDRSFTGIALAFSKAEGFRKQGAPASVRRFATHRLKRAKAALLFTLLMGILTAVTGLVTPLFSQVFMDYILPGRNPEWTAPFLLIMAGVVVYNLIVLGVQDIFKRRICDSLVADANLHYFWHVLRLPLDFFSQRYVGDIIFRAQSNESITTTLVDKLGPLLVHIGVLALYLGFMLQYSVGLTLIGLGAVVINMLVVRWVSAGQVDHSRATERDTGKFFGVTMSCLDNMDTIKAAGAERGFFEHWAGHFTCMHNSNVDSDRYSLLTDILPELLKLLTNSLVLITGIYLILDGEFTIGMLLAFQAFMSAFLAPVDQLMDAASMLIEMRSQMERVEDVLQYPTDKALAEHPADGREKLGGEVELRHVTFGYNQYSAPQVIDFSLHLHPGQSVALVGASGCGKSTLGKLIAGLYQPWEGEILFDGQPIGEIDRRLFTNSVAIIDQNVVLFNDTLSANIKMWDNSIEDFAMILACRDAQIREDIISRPEGFGTQLIKGGQNFSGGQRQRIEIATALAREPVILIMDEATSALDAETEKRIMDAIKMSGATLIIIAHRLSTIRDCDEIIVMEKGAVTERGTHESLLAQGGKYSELMRNN